MSQSDNVDGACVHPQVASRESRAVTVKRRMSSIPIMLLLGALFVSLPRESLAQANTNLPGADFRNFETETPGKCADACKADEKCLSWTFAWSWNPHHCWLKSGIPQSVHDTCCVSGVSGRHFL
jgi:PAN domain